MKNKNKLKNFLRGLVGSVSVALTLWACDTNELDIDIDWSFKPEIQLAETTHIKDKTDMNVKIHSSVYKQGFNTHLFQYSGNKSSFLVSPKGDTILMNKETIVPFDGQFHQYKFVGNEGGDHDLKFVFRNDKGFKTEVKKKIEVKVSDFVFTTTAQSVETIIGKPISVAYTLEPVENNEQTFELRFETSGDGTLNGHNEGVWFEVKKGGGTLTFIPTTAGQHQVTVYARSSFGVVKTSTFTTGVNTQRFNFTAAPSVLQFLLDKSTPINMNITPIDDDSGLTYELKYEIMSGAGEIEGMTPGIYKSVNKGDFEVKFSAKEVGSTTIKFTAKNSAGTEVEKTISLNTISAQFNVTAINLQNNVFIHTPVEINYSIDDLGVAQTFDVMMITSGTGTIDGHQENIWYPIAQNNGKLSFIPTSLGDHDITLHFRNQYGVSKSVNMRLTSISQDFTFTASATNTNIIIDEVKSLDFNLTQLSSLQGIDYLIKYEVLEGEAEVEGMIPNTFMGVDLGTFSKTIKPKSAGILKIKFSVRNSFNLVKEQTLVFNVQVPDFSIIGTYQFQDKFWLGDNITINYAINQFLSQNQNIEYTIESNLRGTFDGGTSLGTWKKISSNAGQISYNPTEKGLHMIVVKARNQYGQVQQFTLSIQVDNDPIIDKISNVVFSREQSGVDNWTGATQYADFVTFRIIADNGNIKIKAVKVILENAIFRDRAKSEIEYYFNNTRVDFTEKLPYSQPPGNTNPVKLKVVVINENGDTIQKYLN